MIKLNSVRKLQKDMFVFRSNFGKEKRHCMSLIERMVCQLVPRNFYVQRIVGEVESCCCRRHSRFLDDDNGQTRHERESGLSPCYRYRAEL